MELTAIKNGLTNEVSTSCTEKNTAANMGSGSLKVFATPAMAALMEKAATELAEPLLPDGWTTVGIALSLKHTAATAVGLSVRAVAKVTAVEGRKIFYEVTAYDDKEEIGSGTHERFAVQKEKFLTKAESKK